jgi:penicillin-binding protein 2
VVVLDVHSGAVLAAAAAPRFDLNIMLRGASAEVDNLLHGAGHPLLDRTAQMALPPGSVFKVLTAIALLDSAELQFAFDPQARFDCRGYLRRPDAQRCMIYRHYGIGHGPVGLREALAQSCNVYFQHHAVTLGPAALLRWGRRLGFGFRTHCDWVADAGGILPAPTALPGSSRQWTRANTEAIAIGQDRLTATPLQVARLMAAVANGGKLVTPHVVADLGLTSEREVDGAAATPDLPEHRPQSIPGWKNETLAELRAGLEAVVANPDGTGYNTIRVSSVSIAGKTGTAETGGNLPDHAWFAGFAPADAPRIAVVVALEHGGSGAEAAGPIARQVVEHLAEQGFFIGSRAR